MQIELIENSQSELKFTGVGDMYMVGWFFVVHKRDTK